MKKHILFRSILFVCIFIFLGMRLICYVYAQNWNDSEAAAAIDRAEFRMAVSYSTVLEAENAGANVSSLLVCLNQGADLLAEANNFYRVGDFAEAIYYANKCYDSLMGVEGEANELRDSGILIKRQQFLVTSVGSTFAVGIVIFGVLWCWHQFSRKYSERILKMKPEVVERES